MTITCQQWQEFAELALGGAEAALSKDVRAHLAACPVCRHELVEVEEAWSALSLSLEPVAPSPRVIERLLARIEGGSAMLGDARRPTPVRLTRRQRIFSYAVAASVFAALCGGYLWMLRPSHKDLEAKRSVENLAERLGALQQMERLLKSEHVRLVSLHRPEAPTTSQAYVVWDLSVGQWHFFAEHLPRLPAGQTYQLWARDKTGQLLAGPTFTVDDEGLGSAVVNMPQLDPSGAATAIVTIEPSGGSKQPTGKVLLEAAL